MQEEVTWTTDAENDDLDDLLDDTGEDLAGDDNLDDPIEMMREKVGVSLDSE